MKIYNIILLIVFFGSCSNHYFLIRNRTGDVIREDVDTGALKSFVAKHFHFAPDSNLNYVERISIGSIKYNFVGRRIGESYELEIIDTHSENRFKIYQHDNKVLNISLTSKKRNGRIENFQFLPSGLLQAQYTSKLIKKADQVDLGYDVIVGPAIAIKEVHFDLNGDVRQLRDYNKIYKFKPRQLDRFYRNNLKERIQSVSLLWYPTVDNVNLYLNKIYQEALLDFPYRRDYPYYSVTSFSSDRNRLSRIIDGNTGEILRRDTSNMQTIY